MVRETDILCLVDTFLLVGLTFHSFPWPGFFHCVLFLPYLYPHVGKDSFSSAWFPTRKTQCTGDARCEGRRLEMKRRRV